MGRSRGRPALARARAISPLAGDAKPQRDARRVARSLLQCAHTFTRSGAMDSVSVFRSPLRSEAALGSPTLARGLGWFSLALGAAELAMPRALARLIGV